MSLTLDALELIELRLDDGPPVHVPRRLPGGRDHHSHSAHSLAERCPSAYKRRYLDDEADPPTLAMVAGKAFGGALAHLFATAAHIGVPTPDELAALCACTFDDEVLLARVRASENPAKVREQTLAALDGYLDERAPALLAATADSLVGVERRIELRLAGTDAAGRPAHCEWTLVGYPDLETADEVRDFKLPGKAHPTQAAADASGQGTLYLLARALEGRPAQRFVLDSTRREYGPRSRTPRFAETGTTRERSALIAYQRRVAATTLNLALCEATGSWPHSTEGWWCAAEQCGAWATCPGGALSAGHVAAGVELAQAA